MTQVKSRVMGSAQQYKNLEESVLIDLLAEYTEKCTRTMAGGYPLPDREVYLHVVAVLAQEIQTRKAKHAVQNHHGQIRPGDLGTDRIN